MSDFYFVNFYFGVNCTLLNSEGSAFLCIKVHCKYLYWGTFHISEHLRIFNRENEVLTNISEFTVECFHSTESIK